MTPPIDHSEHNDGPKPARVAVLAVVAVCLMAVAVSALALFRLRSRLDPGLWLVWAFIVAGLFAVSVPLAIWQEKRKRRPGPWPWPEPAGNPHFGQPPPDVLLEGRFSWAPEMFARLSKGWRQQTPEGRNHRRTLLFLSATGLAGLAGGIVFLCLREWSALALIAVSAVLLLFAYSCRIRLPEEVRRGATVRWRFSGERLVLEGGDRPREIFWSSTRAIVRTPAGFILWPDDFIPAVLPMEAFANREEMERCASVMRAAVFNYVDETTPRKKR